MHPGPSPALAQQTPTPVSEPQTVAPAKAAGRRDDVLPGAARAATIIWTATGLERQVFLDHTGRRGRRVRLAGGGLALLSAGWLAALVSGSFGFSDLPSVPPTIAGRPAARVVHVAVAHHNRRRTVQTASLNPLGTLAAREPEPGGGAGTARTISG